MFIRETWRRTTRSILKVRRKLSCFFTGASYVGYLFYNPIPQMHSFMEINDSQTEDVETRTLQLVPSYFDIYTKVFVVTLAWKTPTPFVWSQGVSQHPFSCHLPCAHSAFRGFLHNFDHLIDFPFFIFCDVLGNKRWTLLFNSPC